MGRISTRWRTRDEHRTRRVGRLDRLGETGPAAARLVLVARGEQGFAGDHVDVDARFLVVQILAGARRFRAAFLGYPVLGLV